MHFSNAPEPACLLVDNGSLRPDATLSLRRLARALSARVGREVAPVSLLHSAKIPTGQLGGVPAEVFTAALLSRHAAGIRRILVVPLFFGPSRALTEFIPEEVRRLAAELAGLKVDLAGPLVDIRATHDRRVARMLADNVRCVDGFREAQVVMVDHGSPERAVALVRDHLARQLAAELGDSVRGVVAASMERREGPEYDFNEPLLARALEEAAACAGGAGEIVAAPLFFSPGRHAGPGGDIETICRAAMATHAGLNVRLAPLVGEHPLLIEILADRYHEAVAALH